MSAVIVSAIIPTYNRRELVQRAIDSALAQTRRIDEIIVIDDGSTDGTGDTLATRYGDRIRYHWQPNAGVSAARNTGMRMAQGRYIALLDSDDLWLNGKTALQVDWLDAHPDFGMVLCDVMRVDADGSQIDTFHRREVLPEDGWVLGRLLFNPSLVPASVMFRREVFEDVGGFDTTLRTAEDIDFHLRIARRWRIGVIEQSLVQAMRGHDGLSAGSSTYDDYVKVVERAVGNASEQVDTFTCNEALAITYIRNARGMAMRGRWSGTRKLTARAWSHAKTRETRMQVIGLLLFSVKRWLHVRFRN